MDTVYPRHPILLVDDEAAWLRSLTITLEYDAGIDHYRCCNDGRNAMAILQEEQVSLVLLDLTMPHIRGEDLLRQMAAEHPQLPVIVITGVNQIAKAVECMKLGAYDFFVKTAEKEEILSSIRRALAMDELRQENNRLKQRLLDETLGCPEAFKSLVGSDRRMRSICRYLEAVAESSEPLLVTGDSGTGKELIAKAYHHLSRPDGPWVVVNVAGLDDSAFSDTLFGHTRGAFTGADRMRPGLLEKAEGGVLFLDEIGDLSLASQVKLLRLLQEREYMPLGSDQVRKTNARLVLATNQDLTACQGAGSFRRDLYFRLCAHQVHLPPLRERRQDIPVLLDHFLSEAAARFGKRVPVPPVELIDLLNTHSFPGNVRELRAMAFNAISRHQGGKLSLEPFRTAMENHLPMPTEASAAHSTFSEILSDVHSLPTLRDSAEFLVREALRRSRGNQRVAARLLSISQPALHKRLKKTDG